MPFLAISGRRFHYIDEGTGMPVVLGHGLCMDHSMFAHQIATLAQRYRVIAPDWRGHGQTESVDETYSMEEQAEDLYQLLSALGIKQAHIGGMSMGGMIAVRFAMAHPEMTSSLILIDTDAGPENPAHVEMYEGLAEAFRAGAGEHVVDPVMQVLFAPVFFTNLPEEAARWRAKIAANNPVGQARATQCVTRRSDVRAGLPALTMPVLIVCGEEDIATTPDKSRYMAAHLPVAQLVMVPSAGHTSPVEQPEEVTSAIAGFLAAL